MKNIICNKRFCPWSLSIKSLKKRMIFNRTFLILCFSFNPSFALNNDAVFKKIKATNESAVQSIKDIEVRQITKIYSKGVDINSELVNYKKQNKFRIEIASKTKFTNTKKLTMIYDGNQLWKIESGIKSKISNDKDIFLKLTHKNQWLDNIDTFANVTGVENIEGQPCYRIQYTNKKASDLDCIWVDTLEMLLRKADYFDTKSSYSVSYQKYVTVHQGFKIPCHITVYNGNERIAETSVKSTKVNSGIKDELFDATKERLVNFKRLFSEIF